MTEDNIGAVKDRPDTCTQTLDDWYMEAMRYLACSDHHSIDTDNEHQGKCSRCRGVVDERDNDIDKDSKDNVGRERSWSLDDNHEEGTIPQIPNIHGEMHAGSVKTRRFSDGMLLKPNIKVTNGRVHWADDCNKELIRYRPRKTYTRKPSLNPLPVKSILKNPSEENLVLEKDIHDFDGY